VCVDLQHGVGAPLAPLPFLQAVASQVAARRLLSGINAQRLPSFLPRFFTSPPPLVVLLLCRPLVLSAAWCPWCVRPQPTPPPSPSPSTPAQGVSNAHGTTGDTGRGRTCSAGEGYRHAALRAFNHVGIPRQSCWHPPPSVSTPHHHRGARAGGGGATAAAAPTTDIVLLLFSYKCTSLAVALLSICAFCRVLLPRGMMSCVRAASRRHHAGRERASGRRRLRGRVPVRVDGSKNTPRANARRLHLQL
jgi:hypothetical protein